MRSVKYSEVKDHLRSGDCVLWKSPGLLGWSIRLWSEYSHASMVYTREDGRVYLAESNPDGFVETRMSTRLSKQRDSEVFVFRPEGITLLQQARCRVRALELCDLGRPYPVKDLILNAFSRRLLEGDLFCSEAVAWIWIKEKVVKPVYGYSGPFWNRRKGVLAPRPGDIPEWWPGELIHVINDVPETEKPECLFPSPQ